MNRRLMMAQQNKDFELVYDAASGELPKASDGWNYTINGSTTGDIQNGYLRVTGDNTYLYGRLILGINKTQNLNKSRSVTVRLGNISNMSLNFNITDVFYHLECYPHSMEMIFKVWGNNLYYSSANSVRYQTASCVYDAVQGVTSFYLDDVLKYTSKTAIPKNFNLVISGEGFYEISEIIYKEW